MGYNNYLRVWDKNGSEALIRKPLRSSMKTLAATWTKFGNCILRKQKLCIVKIINALTSMMTTALPF